MFPKFVSQRLDQYARSLQHDDCRLIIITGPPRRGKSTLALRIARRVDPSFTLDRCTWNGTDFKNALANSKPRQAIILDEAIRGGNSRRAMSNDNVDLMDALTIWGSRNVLGIVCYPKWTRLDGAIRDHANARIEVSKRGIGKWFDVYHPDQAKEPVIRARKYFPFNRIPQDSEFWKAYESRSTTWKRGQLQAKERKKGAKAEAIIAAIRKRPDASLQSIADELGVSKQYVGTLKRKSVT